MNDYDVQRKNLCATP